MESRKMSEEPGPVPMFTPEIQAMSPAEAGVALQKMQDALHPAPDPNPTDATGARLLLNKLTADPTWAAALMRGDEPTTKQFHALTALSAAGDEAADAAVGIQEPSALVEYTSGGRLNRRDTATAVQHFQEIGIGNDAILQAMNGARVSPQEHAAATAIMNARKGDAEWSRALLAGDYVARREFTLLNIILASEIDFG
jgi:hypothetical protein